MKKFIALVALVLVSASTMMYAQESNAAARRAERKAERDAERAKLRAEEEVQDMVAYQQAVQALKNKQFVLEANQVVFRNGMSAFVTSNTNFVLMNGNRATVQTAFNTPYPGPNGIGGVTVDGNSSDMKMNIDKKGNVNCSFSVQGIGISAQVFINMSSGNNTASVSISPNFSNNNLTLNGNIVPLDQSNIFKGRSWLMREFIIADNQDISKAGMMFLLSKQKEVSLLLEADNKAELIQQLRLYPQAVIILDYTLFNFAGADELIVLQERFKEADWILFSDELSLNFLRQVLFSSMAFGVVMKDNSKEEIMTAIQCATRKQRYICNHVSNLLLSGASSPLAASSVDDHLLTQTEKNILKEIALGKTTKEIAAEKNLSFHTINSHRKNIFRKLGVNNVHEATKYAMRAGIVDLAEYYI